MIWFYVWLAVPHSNSSKKKTHFILRCFYTYSNILINILLHFYRSSSRSLLLKRLMGNMFLFYLKHIANELHHGGSVPNFSINYSATFYFLHILLFPNLVKQTDLIYRSVSLGLASSRPPGIFLDWLRDPAIRLNSKIDKVKCYWFLNF